jgi:hypothetical protein
MELRDLAQFNSTLNAQLEADGGGVGDGTGYPPDAFSPNTTVPNTQSTIGGRAQADILTIDRPDTGTRLPPLVNSRPHTGKVADGLTSLSNRIGSGIGPTTEKEVHDANLQRALTIQQALEAEAIVLRRG